VSGDAGAALALSEVSRGAATGDVDNDGDVDVLVTNNNGPVRLLLNESARRGPWLQVRLRGVADNRDGLGAKVGLVRKGAAPLWRRVHTDGSYLTARDPRVHFGLGTSLPEALVVVWPSGRQEAWPVPAVDRLVELKQGTGRAPEALSPFKR
jgi:hypothetical protein